MKRAHDTELVFVAAKRTAFGTFGGTLKNMSATDLAVVAARAAIAQAGLKPEDIDHVVFGNVQQTSPDAIYLARHVGLRCELPQSVPAVTVNRLCGSGFEAIVQGAHRLLVGEARCVLVGGTEAMSQAPHVIRGARWGLPLGKAGEVEDSLWSSLTDSFTGLPMAMTAEKLAEQYELSQEDVDQYSVRSQQRHAEAQQAGRFDDEIAAIEVKSRKGTVEFKVDEHGRADTTLEGLAKLPKVFKKDGVIHAGAASGICDGAAALMLCTAAFAAEKGLKPLGRLVNWGVAGCDPTVMGIGPVPAIQDALRRAETNLGAMELVEVNEAFAPQVLAVQRELGIDDAVLNVDGGAIAIGHPLAASGARITTHLLYALRQRGKKVGLGSACIGGGQGIAVIVEAM
ncbi:MAG: acetyl-CoA C-acyltransferase [Myxococcota bacterium]